MKKFKLLSVLFVLLSFMACDQEDAIINNIYDNDGQTGVGFRVTSTSVIVPVEGATATLAVQATTTSTSDRTYNVTVDESSTGSPGDYTIGTVTIPANSYDGSLEVSFVDTNLVDLVSYSLVLNLDLPEGVAEVGAKQATINYNKYLICNDLVLTLNEDFYSDERSWEVTDDLGVVVVSGGPYPQTTGGSTIIESFNLPDGCYTFTIYDAFGDGQFDGNITGGYSLDCSIINHASGTGNWGASQSTDFCVNP